MTTAIILVAALLVLIGYAVIRDHRKSLIKIESTNQDFKELLGKSEKKR